MNAQEIIKKIGEWMVDGEVGASSKYLASLILEGKPKHVDYPYDPSDFNRCVKMCSFVGFPLEQAVFLASKQSKYWKAIYDNFSQIMVLYEEECVGDNWRAPKLYELMKDLRNQADKF